MSIIYPMLCCSPHKEFIDIGLLIVPAAFIGITTFFVQKRSDFPGRETAKSSKYIVNTVCYCFNCNSKLTDKISTLNNLKFNVQQHNLYKLKSGQNCHWRLMVAFCLFAPKFWEGGRALQMVFCQFMSAS